MIQAGADLGFTRRGYITQGTKGVLTPPSMLELERSGGMPPRKIIIMLKYWNLEHPN